MVEGDAKWVDADGGHLFQVHRSLGQNTCIDPLIEVDASFGRYGTGSLEGCPAFEPKIPDLGDDLLVAGACRDVVVHENEVFLRTELLVHADDQAGDGRHFSLWSLQLGDAAEGALANAAAGRVAEVGVSNGIGVRDLLEDAVVRNEFLDRGSGYVVGPKVAVFG